ncbi:MAG: S16 family serine protease [Sulfolobales archaeon]
MGVRIRARTIPIITLLLLIVLSIQPYSATTICSIGSRSIYLLAVAQDPSSGRYYGVATEAYISMIPGNGTIYISITPASQIDMQSSLSIGALIASYLSGVSLEKYDILVRIVSDTPVVGGPSASAFMSIAVLSLLLNQSIPRDVVMTGMIMPDGSIGPVGGIPEKLQAAKSVNASIMLIPYGQAVSTDLNTGRQVNVISEGMNIGIKVVEVRDIYQAAQVFGLNISIPPPAQPSLDLGIRDFIRGWASNLSVKVRDLLAEANASINSMPNLLRSVLSSYYSSALTSISRAEREFALGDYYSAASDYFSAGIMLDLIVWADRVNNNPSLYEDLYKYVMGNMSAAENLYKSLIDRVKSRGFVYLSELTLLNEIAYRVYDANVTASSLPKPGSSILTIDTLYRAVYSLWRINSIYDWVSLYQSLHPSGDMISLTSLERSSLTLANFLQTTFTYLSSLGVFSSSLSNIQQMIYDIYRFIGSGDLIMANAISIQASALSTAIMHQLFTTNITDTSIIVRDLALRYLGDLLSKGGDISLPSLYIMRGDSIQGSDPSSSIYYYELAIMNTFWYIILERALGILSPPTSYEITSTQTINTTITSQPTQITTQRISDQESLIRTLLIASVIVVVILFLLYRRISARRHT